MDETAVIQHILALDGVVKSKTSTADQLVYNVDNKMFAIIKHHSKPLIISLRCDYNLGRFLQERYESVLPGKNLSKNWSTFILTGQLNDAEIIDQIRHAYEQAKN